MANWLAGPLTRRLAKDSGFIGLRRFGTQSFRVQGKVLCVGMVEGSLLWAGIVCRHAHVGSAQPQRGDVCKGLLTQTCTNRAHAVGF